MKKITIKAWLICLISVLFLSAICTCFIAFNTKDVRANQVDYVENQISEYYSLGQTFVSPEAKVVINGTSYLSNKQVLFYPDGSALSSNEYVLTNPGKYYLRYYTTHNGKTVYAQDEFVVKDSVYSVPGSFFIINLFSFSVLLSNTLSILIVSANIFSDSFFSVL